MYIPPKRPKAQKGIYKERSVPAFRRFVRSRCCSVKGCYYTDVVAAHVRYGLPPDAAKGGAGIKPHDAWEIPLCDMHHREEHLNGSQTFYAKYKIDAVAIASALWEEWLTKTEPGQRWRREHDHS